MPRLSSTLKLHIRSLMTRRGSSAAVSCANSTWRPSRGVYTLAMISAMRSGGGSRLRRAPSSIGCPPLRAVLESEIHQPLEQLAVAEAAGTRRLREILGALEIRVGVGLEHVDLPLRGHPEIHTSVA